MNHDEGAPKTRAGPGAGGATMPPVRRAAPRPQGAPRRLVPGAPPALSFAQERMFLLHQLAPDLVAYNTPTVLHLRGPLDLDALRRACDELVLRHKVLRTAVRFDGDDLRVEVLPGTGAPFSLTELPEGTSEAEVRARVQEEVRTRFDLGGDVLLRAHVFRLAADDHVVVLNSHHIATDEVSKRVLLSDLSALYGAFCAGLPSPLEPLALSYADYAAWQRAEAEHGKLGADLAWWEEVLSSAPEAIDLPLDHPRPAQASYRGAKHRSFLDNEVLGALKAMARRERATTFMALLGAFSGLLERYCGQGEVVVGSPVSGRSLAEVAEMVGLFLNTLALRVSTAGDPSLSELVRRARATSLGAFSHQDVPFERVVQALRPGRDLSRNPLFQVLLTVRSSGATAVHLAGLQAEPAGFEEGWAKVDLSLICWESERGLEITWQYATDLFERATIEAMARHFEAFVRAGTEAPDVALSDLPLMDDEERHRVLEEWNATEAPYPEGVLPDLLAQQAAATPDRPAVGDHRGWLTYREVDERANRLAHYLRGHGAGPDVVVAVCVPRSVDMEVAVLAVLKSGAAYLPLDAGYPPDRLAFMLEDSKAAVLVTDTTLAGALPSHPVTVLVDSTDLGDQPAHAPLHGATPDNLAYVIYTSGSTGRPKGVMVPHRGVVNRLAWMQATYLLGEADTVLQKTPLSFDVSAWEVLWPLLAGARLFMARPEGHRDPAYLVRTMREERVSVVHFVPSMLAEFLEVPDQGEDLSLRLVVCSGEALADQLKERFFQRFPGVELHNLYGPTEASIDVTWERCRPGPEHPVLIGRPIANTQVYVLDAHRRAQPAGVPGELYLGGVGLARGYLGRPELTAEKFVPSPFRPGERLYRTGDRARFRPDGRVEYLGRLDDQVKLHGLRIELGEVEAALAAHPSVAEAVAVVREDAPGDRRLVAYVTPAGADPEVLLAHLRRQLPTYMVPSFVVPLATISRTPNGKTDRQALPSPVVTVSHERVSPRTLLEDRLAAIWRGLLGTEEVGVTDDFFELGGTSLLALRLLTRVSKQFNVNVPIGTLFEEPTIRRLAAEIDDDRAAARQATAAPGADLLKPGGDGPPLFILPDARGHLLKFRHLVGLIDIDGPVYGLASRGMDGDVAPLVTMTDIGADMAARVRQVRPHGPYLLAGYCLGGLIAYETGRQLEAAGEEVALVALIDAVPQRPGAGRKRGVPVKAKIAKAWATDWKGKWALVVGFLDTQTLPLRTRVQLRCHLFLARLGATTPHLLVGVRGANRKARASYQPPPSGLRVTLVRPGAPDPEGAPRRSSRWDGVARGGVDLRWVRADGIDHFSMLEKPHVQLLAAQISAATLDARAERAGAKSPARPASHGSGTERARPVPVQTAAP